MRLHLKRRRNLSVSNNKKTGLGSSIIPDWIVIPKSVEAYDDYDIAAAREQEIRENLNLDNDETGIFEIAV